MMRSWHAIFHTESPYYEVKKADVIALIEKRKDHYPWIISFEDPDRTFACREKTYRCLVYRHEGWIRLTVDEFREKDADSYECCRSYSGTIGKTLEDFTGMTEDRFEALAYNTWCNGAR